MSKRIAVIGTGFRPVGGVEPPSEIAAVVSDGFRAELVEIPDGVFPGDPASRSIVDQQYVEVGMRAAAVGYDAIYINTVGDYGLTALRDALDIPVIGAGETAHRAASSHGPYSVVTIWPPSLDFIYERVREQSETNERYLGVTHLSEDADMQSLGDDNNFVTDMRACALTTMREITNARDQAVAEGAAAVILGCTCMAPAAAMLNPHPTAVTLDPMTLGYRFAEYCLSSNVQPEDVDYQRALAQLS